MTELFLERLKRWPPIVAAPAPARPRVAVVVAPWLSSAVPFFSLECALRLAREVEVTIIWDPCNIRFNAALQGEIGSIRRCLDAVRAWLPVIKTEQLPAAGTVDQQVIETLLYENAVARTGGEQAAAKLTCNDSAAHQKMGRHGGRIRKLLQTGSFDWVLVPGGIWGVSGLYVRLATELAVPFSTYDCGEGLLVLAHGGIAAHFADMEAAFPQVIADSAQHPADRERMLGAARAELTRRMAGTDLFQLQPKPSSADPREQWDILVPLNYRSDSAAMCRQRLFPSVGDWLAQVLAWVQRHPTATIAIRQHPCEKIEEYRGSDRWEELIAGYRLGERCRFIAAADEVNTYDLLSCCRMVLPCTSRVGIEAGMFGKPVILGWESYYQHCGFAWNASTVEEYFGFIGQALEGRLVPSDESKEAATVAYYIAEKCFFLETGFTPAPADFMRWVQTAPDALWATPEVALFHEALVTRQQLAVLQNRRFAKS